MNSRKFAVIFLIIGIFLSACSNSEEQPIEGDQETGEVPIEKEDNNKTALEEKDAVVTINDETFYADDLEFFTLMENIQFEINRHYDQQEYEGAELEDRNVYWDEQFQYYVNVNVQLQNLIEIYAMALLAKEKNYFNPVEDIDQEVVAFYSGVENIPAVQELVVDFGETEFRRKIDEYMDYSLLRDRVVDDLIEDLKTEKPNMSEEELNYELAKAYEDLFMDHMNDLQVDIHIGK